MIVETVNPGVVAVRELVEDYVGQYPDFADALRMYGAIMEAQQSALDSISCPLDPLEPEELESRLAAGGPILDPGELEIDGAELRALVGQICRAVDDMKPGGFPYRAELTAWEGLSDDRLSRTRDVVLSGGDLDFEPSSVLSEEDLELVRNILWEGFAPFYRKSASVLAPTMDQSLWQRGSCPVCGGAPLVGMFRQEDGLWVVECSLCHTLWNVQRASCPFCDGSQGSLEFLYLMEDESRRVNYCKVCKRYVKTIDLRNSGKDALLPLEDIVTVQLDLAARQEGLNNP